MKILTYDELSPGLEADRALVHLAAFGGVFGPEKIRIIRSGVNNFAEYVGVFAVDRGRLIGQIFVLRVPYAFADGPETVGGIAAVGTSAERGRQGVARALLEEVHERERAEGIRHTALWTNRSWGAHALYEKLGYRDVYFPPYALRATSPTRRDASRPRGLRRGRRADLADIDRLHAVFGEDRLGFYRRPEGLSETEARLGNLKPRENLLVYRSGRRLRGYAHLDRNPYRAVCGELVAASERVRRELVHEVERAAGRVPLVFQNTVVTDGGRAFAPPRFARSSTSWYGLMGCRPGKAWSPSEAVRAFGCRDPRFVCLAGDRF